MKTKLAGALLPRKGRRRFGELADLLQEVADCREEFGDVHLETAAALMALGILCKEQSQFEEARLAFEESLHVRKQLNSSPSEVAFAMNNLGTCLHGMGRFNEARDNLETSLALRRAASRGAKVRSAPAPGIVGMTGTGSKGVNATASEITNSKDNDVASSLNNLAMLCRDCGEMDSAEAYLREALEIHESIHGEASDLVAENTSGNLGLVLLSAHAVEGGGVDDKWESLGGLKEGKDRVGKALKYFNEKGYKENHPWIIKFKNV